MKNRKSYRNIISGLVIAIIAFVLIMIRIKENLNVFMPHDDDVVVQGQTGDTSISSENIDLSLIEVNDEFFNSMNEKELLNYKVINSIDYFDTVEGEIVSFGTYFNDTVKYIIDIKNNRSVTHIKSSEQDIDEFFNNDVCKELDNKDKTYQDMRVSEYNKEELYNLRKLKPKQRYGNNGLMQIRNNGILVGMAWQSILAEEFLASYLQDYDQWNIEGSEEFIGRKCTKISGKRDCVDTRTKAEKYTALIDDETGVVLKYDEMDASGKAVNGFETKYIKYNETYDPEIFKISTEGYTEKVY